MMFYRYENVRYEHGMKLHLSTYHLVKETPKGYWIKNRYANADEKPIWVSKTARKRRAYPTKYEAQVNYVKRKYREIDILKHRLRCARNGLGIGLRMLESRDDNCINEPLNEIDYAGIGVDFTIDVGIEGIFSEKEFEIK